jgi:hypothetical protein
MGPGEVAEFDTQVPRRLNIRENDGRTRSTPTPTTKAQVPDLGLQTANGGGGGVGSHDIGDTCVKT